MIEYDAGRFEARMKHVEGAIEQIEQRLPRVERAASTAAGAAWAAIGVAGLSVVFHILELALLFQLAARFGTPLP